VVERGLIEETSESVSVSPFPPLVAGATLKEVRNGRTGAERPQIRVSFSPAGFVSKERGYHKMVGELDALPS